MFTTLFQVLPFIATLGCVEKEDTGTTKAWNSAPLSQKSGTCPVIDASGDIQEFTSNGETRKVRFVLPDTLAENMRLVFFFHGLMPEGSDPTAQMVSGLGLQELSNSHNAIVVLPESPVWELVGNRFHLWNIEQGTEENDVQLYDDLRTCMHEYFPSSTPESIDLDSVVSIGFSGGALFSTILLSQRSDTLAASVHISGGANLEVATYSNLFAPFSPPTDNVPVLLFSGGNQDVWPNSSFPIVNFEEGTDNLFTLLRQNQSLAVLCKHNSGHTITSRSYQQSIEWLTQHTYGEPSPFDSPLDEWTDWCEWSN